MLETSFKDDEYDVVTQPLVSKSDPLTPVANKMVWNVPNFQHDMLWRDPQVQVVELEPEDAAIASSPALAALLGGSIGGAVAGICLFAAGFGFLLAFLVYLAMPLMTLGTVLFHALLR
ncbi:hypothetical protein [Planktotalea sp.]|uniref:hypothetical protein n=1 Tax=Planktotalea sp. TaxID=2029877 RepID=UPI003D6C56A5